MAELLFTPTPITTARGATVTPSLFSGIQLEGVEQLVAILRQAGADAPRAAAAALLEEAESIMTVAKKLTPVDSGNLKASGHVQRPELSLTGATVTMGFGGPAGAGNVSGETNPREVGYAVPVHEILGRFHKVGQAKFLEIAALAAAQGMEQRLAARMRLELRLLRGGS